MDTKDFLISYATPDRAVALAIHEALTDAGYSCVMDVKDFGPGRSFVRGMDDAVQACERCIAVMSREYFEKRFTLPEWDYYFSLDPSGNDRRLIHIRIEDFKPKGLAKTPIYIDFVGKDAATQMQDLLQGVKQALELAAVAAGREIEPTPPPPEYAAARDKLWANVKTIPIFGNLYPPIPMQENFLKLSLSHRNTVAREGLYQWSYSELTRHFQMADRHEFEDVDSDVRHKLGRGEWTSLGRELRPLAADALFKVCPAAVVCGLPGAGKTTILRHCAWQAFKANPDANVVFIEAKHLTDSHLKSRSKPRSREAQLSLEHIFQALASLFLFPGAEFSKLKANDWDVVARTGAWLQTEWQTGRVVVLLDALDEGPKQEHREWLAGAANVLMSELWLQQSRRAEDEDCRLSLSESTVNEEQQAPLKESTLFRGAKGDTPELLPGRCFLSLRAAELERSQAVSLTGGPIFLVNALDQEQIRTIARRQMQTRPERFKAFDEQLPYRDDIKKVAGTPLTAMLVVFFYEAFGRFERRFKSYQLLVAFVLEKAWQRIKLGQFESPGRNLNAFLQNAREPEFLLGKPELGLQYRALAYVARRCLYHQTKTGQDERIERVVSRDELLTYLKKWIKDEKHAWLDAHEEDGEAWPQGAEAEAWIKSWEDENLLLPSGHNHVVFMHSTVMEFFAAVSVGELLSVGFRSAKARSDDRASFGDGALSDETCFRGAKADTARVFDRREWDHLETLPILCSRDKETGWRVLGRLRQTSEPFVPEATLPFRCLAETELAEAEELQLYRDEDLIREKEDELDEVVEKPWAYEHVVGWVQGPPLVGHDSIVSPGPSESESGSSSQLRPEDESRWNRNLPVVTDSERLKWLEERRAALKDSMRLARLVILDKYLSDWQNDGTAVSKAQAALLEEMFSFELRDRVKPRLERGLLTETATEQDGESRYWELMRRMRGAEFVKTMEALAECRLSLRESTSSIGTMPNDQNLAYYRAEFSPGLVGFYGSPNFKHGGAVNCVAYSPDGTLAVSASSDCLLILWDVETGREVRRFVGHQGEVNCCAISSNGGWLLSGSADHTLRLWDATTGAELRAFKGHSDVVRSCAFSPDGGRVLSGSRDKTLKLWDAATGAELRAFTGHSGWVRSCGFSPDGERVLSGSRDKTLKLWDAATGAELRVFTGHSGEVNSCAFSPDGGQVLSSSDDRTLKLWDAETGAELRAFSGHAGRVWSCAFSPDGERVLSGSSDCDLKLWDVLTGAELSAFTGHANSVNSCAFSPDGGRLLSGSADTTLKLWDATTGAEFRAFSGHRGIVRSCAFSPDGERVLSGSNDNTLKLWDAATGAELRAFCGYRGSVRSCAFRPDGRRVLSGSADRMLKLWDAARGVELRVFTGHSEYVMSCAFIAAGLRVLSGSGSGTVKKWDAFTGVENLTLNGNSGSMLSCAFGRNGEWVLWGSGDNTLKQWNVAGRIEVRVFTGHKNSVMSCAFSPDGRLVLSGSADKTLKLWDAATGAELRAFTGHSRCVVVRVQPGRRAGAQRLRRQHCEVVGGQQRRMFGRVELRLAREQRGVSSAATASGHRRARQWHGRVD